MACSLICLRRRFPKVAVFLFLFIFALVPYYTHDMIFVQPVTELIDLKTKALSIKYHFELVDNFYRRRITWSLSKLGGILFNREPIPVPNPNENRTFVVLVWKYWNWLKQRHVYRYSNFRKNDVDYLGNCSVKNCEFSGDDDLMDTADAVVIHLQRGLIPEVENRNRKQKWIFLNDESPLNAFSLAKSKPKSLERFYNVFNWSMTYRSDSDVPVPYGRVIPKPYPKLTNLAMPDVADMVPYWSKKRFDVPAALLMSNCGVKARNEFLKKFRKYMPVDVYGGCSDKKEFKNRCPGHFKADCDVTESYFFYLVLENASCTQYLTEKVFYNAYEKGAIPVIFGPLLEDVEALLPPNSYIYVDAKASVEHVAYNLDNMAKSADSILSMHMWRNSFQILHEHGYFGTPSYHLCRVCEALNYNDDYESIYDKDRFDMFMDPLQTCTIAGKEQSDKH